LRLAEFILANVEPILTEWEAFARTIWPTVLNNPATDPATLRDHAEEILRATAEDIRSDQTALQQADKSKGAEVGGRASARVNRASERHGWDRVGSGFELSGVVAEYRALRASVIRLWRDSGPAPDLSDLDDLTRFNESVDQSLTEAVRSYTEKVQRDREVLLASEHEARMDAERANRAKDLFLATLGHEMRTPLNAIVGWIDILRRPERNDVHLAEGLDIIERSTNAQVQLIEDMLDVSRIVSGKIHLDIRECDLIATINAGLDAVRPAAVARDITLDAQLDPAASRAWCDATRVQQIVWNLLSNAIKFTPPGGLVRVTLDREPAGTRISVSDNGRGISSELLPFVFERFRQGDNSNRREFGGLGLGLSIVKHLVEMHGGTVEAYSAGEGQGATFTVRLPIRAVRVTEDAPSATEGTDASNAAPAVQPPVRLDGLRVLVVDDEADARRMLTLILEGVGAQVTTAASVAEALAALSEATQKGQRPDVLVSDIGMPEQNGYDLIREVRRRGHHADKLPAIALTAFATKDAAHEAALAGFQVHVPKPVKIGDLTAMVASLAGRGG
jgi:signal transduction histidine kinase/CheY-like chemotaxis protein